MAVIFFYQITYILNFTIKNILKNSSLESEAQLQKIIAFAKIKINADSVDLKGIYKFFNTIKCDFNRSGRFFSGRHENVEALYQALAELTVENPNFVTINSLINLPINAFIDDYLPNSTHRKIY